MTAAPIQLTLALPHRPSLGMEDFFVSRSNAAAVDLIDSWPNWPASAVAVVGPEGAGKSHLANVWRLRSHARVVAATALDDQFAASLASEPGWVVEDIDRDLASERVLFHTLNTCRELGRPLLLTSRLAPGEIMAALPDLRSRLRAMAAMRIEMPDEALLTAVLVKLFADRQLTVEPHVVAYAVTHVERSMAAAIRLVEVLDGMSLAMQRRVTRPLVSAALAAMGGGDETGASGAKS